MLVVLKVLIQVFVGFIRLFFSGCSAEIPPGCSVFVLSSFTGLVESFCCSLIMSLSCFTMSE